MRPQRPRGPIRPKVSTMPRQQTEASQYIDLYKLTIEKDRLAQELTSIEQRRQQIQTRLTQLEQLVETMEQKAQTLPAEKNARTIATSERAPQPYETLYLDY